MSAAEITAASAWGRRLLIAAPALPLLVLAVTWGGSATGVVLPLIIVALVAAILMGVHHAEVIAHRVGDPFGALILALAVTVLEAGMIIMLMVDQDGPTELARDTLFAAVMICGNLMVGLSLVWAGLRHRIGRYRATATGGMLATLMTLSTLSLVLPRFTSTEPGPVYSGPQLAFASTVSLVLWGVFVFTQTVEHREAFMPVQVDESESRAASSRRAKRKDVTSGEGPYPDDRSISSFTHLVLLVVCLAAVVGLAKVISGPLRDAVSGLATGEAIVGVAVALLVLLPEGISAVVAANRNHLQTSFNLALGSGIASIGLTIPTVALVAWLSGTTLVLGLNDTQMVLLFLTFMLGGVTLASGRGALLQGAIHVLVFAAFVFLTIVP